MDESAHPPDHDRNLGVPDLSDPSHETEDDALEPLLDPDIDTRVRALLADAPDPGPMPDVVSERIDRALRDAALLRVDPGPLSAARSGATEGTGSSEGSVATWTTGGGAVLTMPSRAERPRPMYLVAAVAAAAAVVAVGASALHVTKRPNGAAAVGDTYGSGAASRSPYPSSSPSPAAAGLHIQLSTTAYSAGTLAMQARALLDHPGQPVPDLAAESPGIGPIATPIGLEACLEAIGAIDGATPAPEAVSADLATFDGRPAVVVVVTRGGASTAWAVERSCTTGAPELLKDATPVP